ncbi:MAG: dihydrolipoyl dehydrogenase [Bacillus subtilis]|nr:dihydrolipoyl dehydrogenase [Bacillus subtilis]
MDTNQPNNPDLCIIGAGPGGYVAAIHARKQGMNVVLIEKDQVGGTCLNYGCIPTKAMAHAADLVTEIQHASSYGILADLAAIDMARLIDKKDAVTKSLVDGIRYLLDKHGVTVIHGVARFLDDATIAVTTAMEEICLRPKNIIIATGSKTKHLPIPGIDSANVHDSKSMLANRDLPKRLCIIGGGVIGMEFAFIYGRLGTQVQVLEFLPSILPNIDKDVSQRLIRPAKLANIQIQTQARATHIEPLSDGALRVHYLVNNTERFFEADCVLEAVGRVPQIAGLGLENTTIVHSERGISVDEYFETNVKGIYAIGDVNNRWQLAHAASHQAIAVVDGIIKRPHVTSFEFMPSVVFTAPMIATVGMTEAMAIANQIPYRIVKTPYGANGRALILDQANGFVKLICAAEGSNVLGATVFGPDADHLIAAITLQLAASITVEAVQQTIFAHPTMAELVHEAYLGVDRLAIHYLD